jgi:hypothetical protein
MIFDILEKKLEDAGIGIPGETIFRGFLPSEVEIGVMSRVPLDGIPIDHYIPDRYTGKIQIISRHKDPVLGSAMAEAISKALTVQSTERHEANEERGYAEITQFLPETLPIQFPRLEGDGIEWSQHFKAVFSFDKKMP